MALNRKQARGGAGDHQHSPEFLRALARNPHCRQLGSPSLRQYADPSLRPLGSLALDVEDLPRMPYRRRELWERSVSPWGQMKLALMEIRFLDRYATPGRRWTVVYAGAAPGNHTVFLAGLYPHCTFVLYDPAPFCEALMARPHPRITVVNDFLTEERAAVHGGRDDVLFISDIRTCATPLPVDPDGDEAPGKENAEVAEDVKADMVRQAGWCRAIVPQAAILKFRLPWERGVTPYFRGAVWVQPWAPATSTEGRLVCAREDILAPLVLRDHSLYEERMMYHNTVGRVLLYDHGLDCRLVPGLDHCYDCTSTVLDARAHLVRARPGAAPEPAEVAALILGLVRGISATRTLAHRVTPSTTLVAALGQHHNTQRRYHGDQLSYRPWGAPGDQAIRVVPDGPLAGGAEPCGAEPCGAEKEPPRAGGGLAAGGRQPPERPGIDDEDFEKLMADLGL